MMLDPATTPASDRLVGVGVSLAYEGGTNPKLKARLAATVIIKNADLERVNSEAANLKPEA